MLYIERHSSVYVVREVRVWILKDILRVRVTMPNSVRGR